MKKMIINENQKGFLFKNGKYIKKLDAGKYHLFGGKEIEISNLEQPIVCSKCALETLLADKAALRKILCKKKSNQTLPVKRADREILLFFSNTLCLNPRACRYEEGRVFF